MSRDRVCLGAIDRATSGHLACRTARTRPICFFMMRIIGDCQMLRAVVATILFLASSFVLAHAEGGRVALVVGVSKYEHAPSLPNTLNDAKDMSAALKRLGFDVETVLDPSRSAFEAAVRRYGDRSVGAEESVFHYSGHALETNGHNWLLPATVNLSSE